MDTLKRPVVLVTPLRRIDHPKGDVYHGMKSSDLGFVGFGEAYFTTIARGETKGWKQHRDMQLNLVVPVGEVSFHVHDEATGRTVHHALGVTRYARLTVPPGYWLAFRGEGDGLNLVLNVASLEHDPDEARNVPLETFALAQVS